MSNYILSFNQIGIKNVPQVGGKNASLGEMYQNLTKKGLRVPNGFATTSEAYWYFLESSGLKRKIGEILKGLNTNNVKNLMERGEKIRHLILKTPLPKDLEKAIISSYRKLSVGYGVKAADVAVRSSATAEDTKTASFAGQMESYLNVKGEAQLLEAIKKCISSLFTNRAISYRAERKINDLDVALSVGIQKMVRSDMACSGVMFSCDTESGFADITVINSSWGLGENVVKGRVTPDEFIVYEPLILKGYKAIISKHLGTKEKRLIYSKNGLTKNISVPLKDRQKFTLTDEEILELARYSVIIEKHYGQPMDMEWAKDGKDKKLYLLQARPETVQSQRKMNILEKYVLKDSSPKRSVSKTGGGRSKFKVLVEGIAVGSKIGEGKAHLIKSVKKIGEFKAGEVLVTKVTDPDWEPIMKIAKAIVTDEGGKTSHCAIVARELGIPAVVGTDKATQIIKTGQDITVSCAEGEKGYVYKGLLPFKIERADMGKLKSSRTKIMMNIGNPQEVFPLSFLPNDGVGLAREEFIINNYIGIHPLALLNYANLKDKKIKNQIDKLTLGYKNKVQFYVDKLAEGIGRIAAAFYPKDVIVRFSDFKSNEYANLIGGKFFEPEEANPMIGWRGASRYYDAKFRKAFELECLAIKKVREEMGFLNIIVMIPFCRTIEEGKKVLSIIDEFGLRQEKKGIKPLKVYVMAEIPANVILAEKFAKIFDGFSIGSNDLTQLMLGVDRDSLRLAHIFDERNEAVTKSIKEFISCVHKCGKKVGICGEAPANIPGYIEFLIKSGIDSISVNPDSILETKLLAVRAES
ncbi:MAG: Phosphoenolpyruvate synthase [Parcubacteria group bacterium ADurb.Bin159]|nr:MAG: Phosphoenolpyruvate synthase [Parcubacteria group bacterium ADurb.Bin159]